MVESEFGKLRALIKQGRLERAGLDAVRLLIRRPLECHTIGVAAITGREIHGQEITLVYRNQRYPVPVRVFAERNVHYIAHQIIMAHERAQK